MSFDIKQESVSAPKEEIHYISDSDEDMVDLEIDDTDGPMNVTVKVTTKGFYKENKNNVNKGCFE